MQAQRFTNGRQQHADVPLFVAPKEPSMLMGPDGIAVAGVPCAVYLHCIHQRHVTWDSCAVRVHCIHQQHICTVTRRKWYILLAAGAMLQVCLPGPNPPARHPKSTQNRFEAAATSTPFTSFRLSRCRSACPFVSSPGVVNPDFAARDTGLVPADSLLPSDVGLAERGVELA